MPSRLLNSILFAGVFAIGVSSAQEGIAEVPIPLNVYPNIIACGADGQAYFSSIGDEYFVLRVSLDGSSLTFGLPKVAYYAYGGAVAPYAGGVNVLSSWTDRKTRTRTMYHFDNEGNLHTQHPVQADLTGLMMAITSSGTTILVGHNPANSPQDEDWKHKGLVLDADDRIVSHFDLPSPPGGGEWTYGEGATAPDRLLMTTGDRVAYVLLHSNEPPSTMIATISESGKVNLKTLPEPDNSHYLSHWLLGPGVAVEMYDLLRMLDGRPVLVDGHTVLAERQRHPVDHFDEYDLKSGKKIASKTAPMGEFTPFQSACYYGDSVTGVGAHIQVAPDESYLRLRVAKLQ